MLARLFPSLTARLALTPARRGPLPRVPAPSAEHKQALGRAGERAAARHLRALGYRVLGRNLRVPMGEADLLCEAPDGRTIVLVEVKARAASDHATHQPPPEAAVDADKQRTLRAIIRYLARKNGWHARPLRVDVIAIEWPPRRSRDRRPTLRHYLGGVLSRRPDNDLPDE